MDRLDGGRGDDLLIGGAMADEITGGDDTIDEGAGHGMIEGGGGGDVITDFEATGDAQGAFDHLAFRDILASQVSVTDTGALIAWDTDEDGDAEGSVLLVGVGRDDLRQSDFMFFGEPGFVPGINDYGSWYVFA